MTTLALFAPETLVGMELRKALAEVEISFERVLGLSSEQDDVGNLLDIAGQAARVEGLTSQSFEDIDLVISCTDMFQSNLPLLTAIGQAKAETDVILVAPDTPNDAGQTVVPGINLERHPAVFPSPAVIPHPGVITLSQMLHGLADLGIESSSSTILQPASVLGQEAMNEVFGQARSLLTMDGSMPTEHLGFQTAFSSTLPRQGGDSGLHRRRLRSILGTDGHDLQMIQAGSFHGLGISSHLRFSNPVSKRDLDAAFSCFAGDWELLQQDQTTVGRADADGPGWTPTHGEDGRTAWVWIAADNLTHAIAPAVTSAVVAWIGARANR